MGWEGLVPRTAIRRNFPLCCPHGASEQVPGYWLLSARFPYILPSIDKDVCLIQLHFSVEPLHPCLLLAVPSVALARACPVTILPSLGSQPSASPTPQSRLSRDHDVPCRPQSRRATVGWGCRPSHLRFLTLSSLFSPCSEVPLFFSFFWPYVQFISKHSVFEFENHLGVMKVARHSRWSVAVAMESW